MDWKAPYDPRGEWLSNKDFLYDVARESDGSRIRRVAKHNDEP